MKILDPSSPLVAEPPRNCQPWSIDATYHIDVEVLNLKGGGIHACINGYNIIVAPNRYLKGLQRRSGMFESILDPNIRSGQ